MRRGCPTRLAGRASPLWDTPTRCMLPHTHLTKLTPDNTPRPNTTHLPYFGNRCRHMPSCVCLPKALSQYVSLLIAHMRIVAGVGRLKRVAGLNDSPSATRGSAGGTVHEFRIGLYTPCRTGVDVRAMLCPLTPSRFSTSASCSRYLGSFGGTTHSWVSGLYDPKLGPATVLLLLEVRAPPCCALVGRAGWLRAAAAAARAAVGGPGLTGCMAGASAL